MYNYSESVMKGLDLIVDKLRSEKLMLSYEIKEIATEYFSENGHVFEAAIRFLQSKVRVHC